MQPRSRRIGQIESSIGGPEQRNCTLSNERLHGRFETEMASGSDMDGTITFATIATTFLKWGSTGSAYDIIVVEEGSTVPCGIIDLLSSRASVSITLQLVSSEKGGAKI